MSENSESSNSCPECGATLPAEVTGGLCPRCLMGEAMLPTGDGTGFDAESTPLTPDELAEHFPQLDVLECLGRGGMGVVYKARQKSLNRIVALKLLAPERIGDAGFADRFAQEAQALAALNHPNIVTVYDFGKAGGFYFLLMEFVDGVNLRQAMQAGRFTPEQALAVVPPVCEAMQAAHNKGIVHRDIKPENLLLDKDGNILIADFGIAKMLDVDDAGIGLAESQPAGTPQYMAPEQKEHTKSDHRADIYSLGVVLYELLTGELPSKQLQPPSCMVQVDVRLDEIVLRALEATPELRFQTAADLRTQVETMIMTPVAPPAKKPVARFIKSGFSILTTPEHLGTFMGQMFCIRTRGQLILDGEQLIHSRNGVDTVIPLKSVRDVSLGRLPGTVNPAGLDLISVTCDEDGETKHHLLSPQASMIAAPATHNAGVGEWFRLIREAVTDVTGKEPTASEGPKLPDGTPGMYLFYAGIFLAALLPLVILLQERSAFTFLDSVVTPGLISVGVILLAGGIGAIIRRSRPDASGLLSVLMFIGIVVVVMLGVVFAASNRGVRIVSQPPTQVIATYAPSNLDGNSLIMDMKAVVSDGPAEMQVYLIGPALSPDEMIDSLGISDRPDLDIIRPNGIQLGAPFRLSTNGPNHWQVAFVLPTPALAQKVRKSIQPIGPLDVRHDRGTAGELFRVSDKGGATYTAYFAVGPIGQHLRGKSKFPIGAHLGGNNHSVLVKHDHVNVHYALYHAGDFDSSSRGTQNPATGSWEDAGSIRLRNKRSFSYHRTDRYPDELTVNGQQFDLREGRIFVLLEDGTIEQLTLKVPLQLARSPIALGELISRQKDVLVPSKQ